MVRYTPTARKPPAPAKAHSSLWMAFRWECQEPEMPGLADSDEEMGEEMAELKGFNMPLPLGQRVDE